MVKGIQDVWQAATLILAPLDSDEAGQLKVLLGNYRHDSLTSLEGEGLNTPLPGIFVCHPDSDPVQTGAAAVARAAAWLGRNRITAKPITATVDSARCRACNTCVALCQFGASMLVGEGFDRYARIDPVRCTGCGLCAAHCPSDAINAGYSTDAQMDAMLDALLTRGNL